MTIWEYARLEYQSTASFGTDKEIDWIAMFHSSAGVKRWGTDERFNDLKHLNRAGADGWQAYDRSAVIGEASQRLQALTYSFKRPKL